MGELIFSIALSLLCIGFGIFLLIKNNKAYSKYNLQEDEYFIRENLKNSKTEIVLYIIFTIAILLGGIFRFLSFIDFSTYVIIILISGCVLYYTANLIVYYYYIYFVVTPDTIKCYSLFSKETKEILISSIKECHIEKKLLVFSNDNKQALLACTYLSLNINCLLKTLYLDYKISVNENILKYYNIEIVPQNVENSDNQNSELNTEEIAEVKESDKYSTEQLSLFTKIGEEFRLNVSKNKKIDIFKIILMQIIVFLLVSLLIILSGNFLFIIVYALNIYLLTKSIKNYRVKYHFEGFTDLDLGLKYASLNHKVKGYHLGKMNSIKSTGRLIGIIMIIITLFYGYNLFYNSQPLNYDNSISISGTINEVKNEQYISITIITEAEQYSVYTFVIPNALEKYIETDMVLNSTKGENIEIKTFVSSDSKLATIIYLKINDQELINQKILDQYYYEYINGQKIIFYSIAALTVIIIGGSITSYYILKSKIKNEIYDLSK